MGPIVSGTEVPFGVSVPGTSFKLDPVKAADIGCAIRWLDFNDAWLAAEWGHPSDNLGASCPAAILYLKKELLSINPIFMNEVLEMMIKAHEIQGILAQKTVSIGLD